MKRLLFKDGYAPPGCPPELSPPGIKGYRRQNVAKNFALKWKESGKRQ